MPMPRGVSFTYVLKGYYFPLNHIAETVENHRRATASLVEKHGENIALNDWFQAQQLGGYSYIKINIVEKTPGSLEAAVKDYISLAGLPSVVGVGSDYRAVRRVLEPLGQTLKTPILAAIALKTDKRVVKRGLIPQFI